MQSHIIQFPQTGANNVEQNLKRMKTLKTKITALTAEYKLLEKCVIDEYFSKHDTYTTEKGLVLATYKQVTAMAFSQSDFKAANPDLYQQFSSERTQYRFLLK